MHYIWRPFWIWCLKVDHSVKISSDMISLTPKTPDNMFLGQYQTKTCIIHLLSTADSSHFEVLGSQTFRPHFREGHPRLISYLTFIEDKFTIKLRFPLHGHGSSENDPTITWCSYLGVSKCYFGKFISPSTSSRD